MKIKATFILAFFGLLATAQAQSSFPTASDSARWFVSLSTPGGPGAHAISFSRDSLLSGNVYQVYEQKTQDYSGVYHDSPAPDYIIRTQGSQVFTRLGQTDYLLYDFALNVGDTVQALIRADVNAGLRNYWVVADSVVQLTNGPARKLTMAFQETMLPDVRYVDWIEGVGTASHPFICQEYYACQEWFITNCMKIAGDLHRYAPAGHTVCQNQLFIDGLDEHQEGHTELYPNPMSASASLSVHGVPAKEAQISVVNLLGQQVEKRSLWLTNGSGRAEIGAGLPAGLYVLHLTVNGLTSKMKLEKR